MHESRNEEDASSSTLKLHHPQVSRNLEDTVLVSIQENSQLQPEQLESTAQDIKWPDVVDNYQNIYKGLMKINYEIQTRYWYCTRVMEFCFATNIIFSITFMIYFMNPTDHENDAVVLCGDIVFLFNAFCFGYGNMAIQQRCYLKTKYFIKLLYINLLFNACLMAWFLYLAKEVGVIPSAFGSISNLTVLITGRGIGSIFLQRKEICAQLQPVAEMYSFSLNLES